MTWEDHVKAISMKIIQKTGLLKRISHFLPPEWRNTLYNSPVCRCSIMVIPNWRDKGNATLMNELQLLQNKAVKMKIVPSLPCFYSSTEVLNALCQSTLIKRRLFLTGVSSFFFKYVNGLIYLLLTLNIFNYFHFAGPL